MSARASLLAGLKATAMGALVGTSLPSVFFAVVAVGIASSEPAAAIGMAVLPFGVGWLVSGIGLVVLGWPLTTLLHRRGRESWRAYFLAGLLAGTFASFGAAWTVMGEFLEASLVIAGFGALTGGATGHFWWVYARKARARAYAPALVEVFE